MPNYRLMNVLQHDSALPEDRSVNVWHVIADDDTAAQIAVDELIGLFYQPLDAFFSQVIEPTLSSVVLYDLADAEPRVPVSTTLYDLGTVGAGALPSEVAGCVSFQAAQTSGQPQARRRGRVFIGPLTSGVSDVIGGVARLSATFQDGLRDAADAFLTQSNAAATWGWAVRSVTDDVLRIVTNGWVDNAFDTQRRRGERATTRLLFS